MNTLKNSKKTKYTLAIGTVLIASSAVAAVATLSSISAPDKFAPATPTANFELKDGTATVETSQLEWSRCLVGQTFSNGACTGEATKFATWEAALAAPSTQQAAEGWRVPNVKELVRITENTEAFPAINTEVFPFGTTLTFEKEDAQYGSGSFPTTNSSPYIWSSTPSLDATPTTNPETFQPYTPEEYKEALEKSRLNAEKAYAIDFGLGNTTEVYRSGESVGERYTSQYGNNDPNNAKKARYVLLVKDVS